MASVFRSEKRTVQRFVGLPETPKVRLWPTVDAILQSERSDREDIADQIVYGALDRVLIAAIIAGRYRDVHAALGKLLRIHATDGKAAPGDFPDGKPLPMREAKPLSKAAGR